MTLKDIREFADKVVDHSEMKESITEEILPLPLDILKEVEDYVAKNLQRDAKSTEILIEWGLASASHHQESDQELHFLRLKGLWISQNEENFNKAYQILEESLKLAEDRDDIESQFRFHLALADIAYAHYEFDTAEEWLLYGYDRIQSEDYPKWHVQFLSKLGILYKAKKQSDEALKWYELAEKYALENELHFDYISALLNRGHLFTHSGGPEKAEVEFRKAIDYLQDVPDDVKDTTRWWNDLANLYYSLSSVVHSQEKYHEALLALEEAAKIIEDKGEEALRYKALIAHMFSSVYSTLKDYEKATVYDQEAYDISQKINFKALAVVSQTRIAGHYQSQKKYEEAKKILIDYLPELEKIHQPHILVQNWIAFGNIEFELEKYIEAEKCFRKAIEMAGDSISVPGAYEGLGRLYKKQGEYEKAIAEIEKVLAIYEEHDNLVGMIQTHHLMGELLDANEGSYEVILNHFEIAAKLMNRVWEKYSTEVKEIEENIDDLERQNEYYRFFNQRYQELITENYEQIDRIIKTLHHANETIDTTKEELDQKMTELDKARQEVEKQQQELELAHKKQVEQQEIIMELSTPVIQLYEGILTAPVIGTIDSRRADQLMENILVAITEYRAEIAIIDITGVPIVDTEVANRLTKMVQAAHLLGAECILVGISPQISQTLVHIGVDLSDIMTRSRLQDGFELALKMSGYRVKKRKSKD